MQDLTIYHQKRRDGGIRTGVELNGERVLELLKTGRLASDPALEWFVDVRLKGSGFPSEPEEIRDWLLDQGPKLTHELERTAEKLAAGIDPGWPFVQPIRLATPNIQQARIVCSAARRLDCRTISRVLLQFGKNWGDLMGSLHKVALEEMA
jgi:hypothetical protein